MKNNTLYTLSIGTSLLISLQPGIANVENKENLKPNVICILVDDLGYGDLSCQGAKDIRTPNIDNLMKQGKRFTSFYANCPVCSPTRASLLTGCYPDMVGVPGVIRANPEDSWGYLSSEAFMLPSLLKNSGYNTALIGKWHLGLELPNTPNERGFDFFHGFLGDMMDDYYTHLRGGINYLRYNNKEISPEGHDLLPGSLLLFLFISVHFSLLNCS